MNLENNVENIVTEFMGSGKIEEKVNEYMEKATESAIKELFTGYNAPVEKEIKEQLKSVMIPAIERYDYSKYIVKLEKILIEVLDKSTLENRKILENFKDFAAFENPESINISELFEKWCIYVSKNLDTSDLEIDYDDRPMYESSVCTMEISENDDVSWSSFEHKIVTFTCDKDEEMNIDFPISRYKRIDKGWNLSYKSMKDLESFRTISSFEVFLMNLDSCRTEINLDEEFLEVDDLDIEAEPEADFY